MSTRAQARPPCGAAEPAAAGSYRDAGRGRRTSTTVTSAAAGGRRGDLRPGPGLPGRSHGVAAGGPGGRVRVTGRRGVSHGHESRSDRVRVGRGGESESDSGVRRTRNPSPTLRDSVCRSAAAAADFT